MSNSEKDLKDKIKNLDKKEREKAIEYELSNYECYYTCEIDNALDSLKEYGISREEVVRVYQKNKHKHYDD
jgi:hypothetical protein